MQDLEQAAGVGGQKDILPIKNLCDESKPTIEASILVLSALQHALYAATDYLRECEAMETSSEGTQVTFCTYI